MVALVLCGTPSAIDLHADPLTTRETGQETMSSTLVPGMTLRGSGLNTCFMNNGQERRVQRAYCAPGELVHQSWFVQTLHSTGTWLSNCLYAAHCT